MNNIYYNFTSIPYFSLYFFLHYNYKPKLWPILIGCFICDWFKIEETPQTNSASGLKTQDGVFSKNYDKLFKFSISLSFSYQVSDQISVYMEQNIFLLQVPPYRNTANASNFLSVD